MKRIETMNVSKCYMQHEVILTNPIGMVMFILEEINGGLRK